MWDRPVDYPENEIPKDFQITEDRNLFSEAVAVVFHMPSLVMNGAIQKRPGQIWIAFSMECDVNYPVLRDPDVMKFFDLTMTYHLNADVIVPYVYDTYETELRIPPGPKNDDLLINAFISSSYNRSGRIEYLSELMQHLDVHSYGRLYNNRTSLSDDGEAFKLKTIGKYKFTIAFENAVGEDYVTEKFFHPLLIGSVPVYLGAPNIDDFAPGDQCFVNTTDFANPGALADYLERLAKNEELYNQYFLWKNKPFQESFVRILEKQKVHPIVRMCHEIKKRL